MEELDALRAEVAELRMQCSVLAMSQRLALQHLPAAEAAVARLQAAFAVSLQADMTPTARSSLWLALEALGPMEADGPPH